jgi:hypothetical protein
MHHEAQVREHQFARRVEIVVAAKAQRELLFLLASEHGNPTYPIQISIETSNRTREAEAGVLGDQRSLGVRHFTILLLW